MKKPSSNGDSPPVGRVVSPNKAKKVKIESFEVANVEFDEYGNPVDALSPSINRSINQAKLNLLQNLHKVYDSVLRQATVSEVEWMCACCGETNEVKLPYGSLTAAKIVLDHVEHLMEMFRNAGGIGVGDMTEVFEKLSVEQIEALINLLKSTSR